MTVPVLHGSASNEKARDEAGTLWLGICLITDPGSAT